MSRSARRTSRHDRTDAWPGPEAATGASRFVSRHGAHHLKKHLSCEKPAGTPCASRISAAPSGSTTATALCARCTTARHRPEHPAPAPLAPGSRRRPTPHPPIPHVRRSGPCAAARLGRERRRTRLAGHGNPIEGVAPGRLFSVEEPFIPSTSPDASSCQACRAVTGIARCAGAWNTKLMAAADDPAASTPTTTRGRGVLRSSPSPAHARRRRSSGHQGPHALRRTVHAGPARRRDGVRPGQVERGVAALVEQDLGRRPRRQLRRDFQAGCDRPGVIHSASETRPALGGIVNGPPVTRTTLEGSTRSSG
jgi:hypothetical protein